MQYEYSEENPQFSMISEEQDKAVIRQFIQVLKNQRRMSKEQFQQKKFDQEDFFDTQIEARENGSHLSNLSEDTQQSFISIHMSDYVAKKVQQILEYLYKGIYIQNEKYQQKANSDVLKQSSKILDVKQYSSDVYQSNTLQIYSDFSNQSNIRQKNNQKESQKHLNLNQIQKSLQQIQDLYRKWLQEIQSSKQLNNQQSRLTLLQEKFTKFQQQQQKMLLDQLIFKQYIQIINQNQVICQEHAMELNELQSFLKN